MTLQLNAQVRTNLGRCASRRLRRDGNVPAVIYGVTDEVTLLSLDHNMIYHALKRPMFHTSILSMTYGPKTEKVLLRDFQMHAYRSEVLHLDFQRITDTELVNINVPLIFINEDKSPAVKLQHAHITKVITEVEVRALAANIPHSIEIDLHNLSAGQSIHLSDVKVPNDVSLTALLRGDDAVIAIAAGIAEEVEAPVDQPVVAAADIPAMKGDATVADKDASATNKDNKDKDKK